MEQKNINGRQVYVIFCRGCGKELHIYKTRLKTSTGLCAKCMLIERNCANKGNYKHTHNKNYFSERSLQSIYWAGFIAADGCISDKGVISIKIKESDIERLETFIKDTAYDGKVLLSGKENRKRVVITSHEWSNDLLQLYNIAQRKSLTMPAPNNMSLEESLAYIIGYIDGDGSIYYTTKYNYLALSIVGTKEFLEWVQNIFDSLVKVGKAKKSITPNGNIYEYKVYGKRAQKLISIMYDIPVSKMERKWNKQI